MISSLFRSLKRPRTDQEDEATGIRRTITEVNQKGPSQFEPISLSRKLNEFISESQRRSDMERMGGFVTRFSFESEYKFKIKPRFENLSPGRLRECSKTFTNQWK